MTPKTSETSDVPKFKTFISYSRTSEEYSQWVLKLAERLQMSGIEVVIDQWYLKFGQDLYPFMEQMVSDPSVKKVLMLCDWLYAEKADGRMGGVGTETQIITPQIYEQVGQTKFVPVITGRDEDGKPCKPVFLKSLLHIDLSDPSTFEKGFDELLRDIVGKPLLVPPPLGKLPSYLLEDAAPPSPTAYSFAAFKSALLNDKSIAIGLAEDYLDQFLEQMDGFRLGAFQDGSLKPEQILRNCLAAFLPLRDEFIDFLLFSTRYGKDARLFGLLPDFFSKALKYVWKSLDQDHSMEYLDYEAYRFLVPELFLYTVAALLKRKHFNEVNDFLSRRYVETTNQASRRVLPASYVVLEPHLPILELGARPLSSHRPQPVALLLHERATCKEITIDDLIDTDYLLYVRQLLNPDPTERYSWSWEPILRNFINRSSPMPFFTAAQSRTVFESSKMVLNVQNKQDLSQKFDSATGRVARSPSGRDLSPLSRDRVLIGIEDLDTV